jgi:predicted aldo/keto reductase-like oxidoreductase
MKVREKETKIMENCEDILMSINTKNIDSINMEVFQKRMNYVKTASGYVQAREVMRRISQSQQIRVFTLVTENPEEMKKYIEVSMPQMLIHDTK